MMLSATDTLNLRVAILAPTGKDAALTTTILDEAAIESLVCPDIPSL